MDVQFDDDLKKSGSAKTRIYSPSKTGNPTPVLEDTSMPIRPQPDRTPRKKRSVRTEMRLTTMSKILILLSVFTIAATALFALFGAADYARIISETASVNKEIESYNQQISQLKKTQSSMNDFATINEVCRRLGMTMSWYKGTTSSTPISTTEDTPETTAPATSAPNGEEP
jgi:cell division protein FtsL